MRSWKSWLTETVRSRGTGVELQTQDASVGDVLDATLLSNLPTLSRDATLGAASNRWRFRVLNGAVAGSGRR